MVHVFVIDLRGEFEGPLPDEEIVGRGGHDLVGTLRANVVVEGAVGKAHLPVKGRLVVEARPQGEGPVVSPTGMIGEGQSGRDGEFLGTEGPIMKTQAAIEDEARQTVPVDFPAVLHVARETESVEVVGGDQVVAAGDVQDARGIVQGKSYADVGMQERQRIARRVAHGPLLDLVVDDLVLRFQAPTQGVVVGQLMLTDKVGGRDYRTDMVARMLQEGAVAAGITQLHFSSP